MVGGKDWEEHNQNLETLLERLTVYNITLRREKCEFGHTSLEFYDHQFTSEGLRPSPSKVRAISCKTAHGYQPVHYVSRTLTDTERKYAQIERVALAVEFSTNRLQMYLLGPQEFQIATDHKPFIPIFNNPSAKLPPRLERLRMKTQHLDFVMIHITGKSNMTDYLSRHPLPYAEEAHLEHHARAVIATDHAVVLDKIREETRKDSALQALIQTIRTGNWKSTGIDLKHYYDIRTEIYEADGVVLRGDRIIPPTSLRKRIINIAHKQGHFGIIKTKEMIRNKYWFPLMNIQIENIVQSCFSCQIATNSVHTKPAKMTTIPQPPWEVVELDFCGPFPNGEYAMVLTEQFSRYRK